MSRWGRTEKFLGFWIPRAVFSAGVVFFVAAGNPLSAALVPRSESQPGFRYAPSPEKWSDMRLYYIMTDRFKDGDPSNNEANPQGPFRPTAPDGIHGGDFKGFLDSIGYLELLGVNAVAISPVFQNVAGAYHGDHAFDYGAIEPHLGTLEELQACVDEAHRRGMRFIIEMQLNHMGPLLKSSQPGYPRFSARPYAVQWADETVIPPEPFNVLSMFHAHGDIQNWFSAQQIALGALPGGLADLATEQAAVREALVKACVDLIAATDCDGFHFDSAGYLAAADWVAILDGVREGASRLGKSNFLLMGEHPEDDDEKLGELSTAGLFDSLHYHPMHYTMMKVFVEDEPPARLMSRREEVYRYAQPARDHLVSTLDGPHGYRVLSRELLNENAAKLRPALAYLLLGPEIPALYYGTEQGFNGSGDHYNREDMFDGEFEFGPSIGDNFNPAHPLFALIRALNMIHDTHDVFQAGTPRFVFAAEKGPGLVLMERTAGTERGFVLFNTSRSPLVAGEEVFSISGVEPGTTLLNLLDESETFLLPTSWDAEGAGLEIPGYGVKVLVQLSSRKPLRPSIASCVPGYDRYRVHERTPISIRFDRPMDVASVEQAFALEPDVEGTITWDDYKTHLQFSPEIPWAADTDYRIVVERSARSAEGAELGGRFVSMFSTGLAPEGEKASGRFVMDGMLDENAVLLAKHGDVCLYGRYDPASHLLYLATQDAGEGYDKVIIIDDNLEVISRKPAPMSKAGMVCSEGAFLFDKDEDDSSGWGRISTADAGSATGINGGMLEGVINLQQLFGEVPLRVFIAVASYSAEDGGALNPREQIPEPETWDENITLDEFFRFTIRDRVVTE